MVEQSWIVGFKYGFFSISLKGHRWKLAGAFGRGLVASAKSDWIVPRSGWGDRQTSEKSAEQRSALSQSGNERKGQKKKIFTGLHDLCVNIWRFEIQFGRGTPQFWSAATTLRNQRGSQPSFLLPAPLRQSLPSDRPTNLRSAAAVRASSIID